MPEPKIDPQDINIDVSVPVSKWQELEFDAVSVAKKCACETISMAEIPETITGYGLEVSISLTDDEHIQKLNREYRNMDKPTNVLSFASVDATEQNEFHDLYLLGDTVLSYETIAREAIEQNKSFESHFSHMVIHGVLHLLGYDHQKKEDAEIMESTERKIMGEIGYKNPYE
jgi:probable rRNA maturation factor